MLFNIAGYGQVMKIISECVIINYANIAKKLTLASMDYPDHVTEIRRWAVLFDYILIIIKATVSLAISR